MWYKHVFNFQVLHKQFTLASFPGSPSSLSQQGEPGDEASIQVID